MELIQKVTAVTDCGYETISNILSDRVAVLFSVPCREWNKLEKSDEWIAFQDLLEKAQEESDRI